MNPIRTLATRSDMPSLSLSQLYPSLARFSFHTVPSLLMVTIFFIHGCTPQESDNRLPSTATNKPNEPATQPLDLAEQVTPPPPRLDNPPSGQASDPQALQLLKALIQKYRSAQTYFDRGVVRLKYTQSGQTYEDSAKLSVVFNRSNSMLCKAYAAEIEIRNGTVQARLEDPLTNNFDHQTLVRKLKGPSFGLPDIYCDPTLTHFSTAGLGGPSPQLELLLSENPFGGLLQGNSSLSLDSITTPEGIRFEIVQIQSGDLRYRFWIDAYTMLLRRVELPPEAAGLEQSPTITAVELSIELNGAQWEIPSDAIEHLEAKTQGPRVTEFVLPPPTPTPFIGQYLPPFSLQSTEPPFQISQQGSDCPLTVLLWIVDHPGCRLAAQELQRLANLLAQDSSNPKTRYALIMAEPGNALPGRSPALMQQWQIDLPVIDDHAAVGQQVFGISDAPTLVVLGEDGLVHWFQQRVGPEMTNTIPNLIKDLASGKSVGEEIRKQHEADQQTYQSYLKRVAVEN